MKVIDIVNRTRNRNSHGVISLNGVCIFVGVSKSRRFTDEGHEGSNARIIRENFSVPIGR